ncbi:hypothetical protein BDW02DRAFT_484368, partial [Decorospora gaudefroyi]
CCEALLLTNPRIDRETVESVKGTIVEGTCKWITHDVKYRAWLNSDGTSNGDTRLLCISGGPGKGKTMLSVFLTKELEKHTAGVYNAELAFFFCSAQDPKRNTAVAVLRGLIHQILSKRPQLVKHAQEYFKTPEQTQQTLLSLEALWLIFNKLAEDVDLGNMFCVLDGLDECDEDTHRLLVPRILRLLSSEGSTQDSEQRPSTFKLAIVSREIPCLQKCTKQLNLDNKEMASDIERVVSTRVDELSHIPGFNEELRAQVQKKLLQRAEGTFLWVGFAVHELSQKKTCTEVFTALESLPRGLNGIYSRMLLRIPAEQRQDSIAILRWVTLAVRPLKLQELAVALGVQPLHPLSLEQAISDKITEFGPFLKVQESTVGLVHQSAREYLLREQEDSDVVLEAFRVRPQNGHLLIVQLSLDCVAQSGFQQEVVDLESPPSQESPLLQYAAIHWPQHARSCATLD